jgi:hypothetical protein
MSTVMAEIALVSGLPAAASPREGKNERYDEKGT